MARSRNSKNQTIVIDSENWYDAMLPGFISKKDQKPISKRANLRLAIIIFAIVLSLSGLVTRLVFMQVINAEAYDVLANGNRVRLEVQYAPRGKILDRNNNVLADNTLAFQLTVTPYLLPESESDRRISYQTVANILELSESEISDLAEEKGTDFVQPLILAEFLTHDQARLLEVATGLEGYSIDQVPVRKYDASGGMAHIVGYTGRVSEEDLELNDSLLPADFIGRSGVESQYDSQLRGTNGWKRIEVDALGRPVRVLANQDPTPGSDVTLTIDRDLQVAMMNATLEQMGKAKVDKASGVALHPQTGEVLAIVSVPTYDNNLFSGGITQADFERLVNDSNQPLFNKAIAGGFSSGSTIKPVVASAALQEGVVNENTTIVDTNDITLPGGFTFRSWRPGGLGPMNVRRAIAWSSNIYFYTVGGGYGGIEGLGHPRIQNYYRAFGLGETSGLDLPGEETGRVPDEAWKMELTGEGWYQGDSFNISIGQGDLLISPLQLALAHSAIANNGELLQPYVASSQSKTVRRTVPVDQNNLQIVREGMRQVLTGGTTCECVFNKVPVKVAGKSGTAETNPESGKRPHAWFSAYAPYESPEIIVSLLLEEGVGGSQFAAPAIAKTMEHYFTN